MKKVLLLFLLSIILSACQGTKNIKSGASDGHENRFDNNENLRSDLEMYEEHMNRDIPDCHTLCYDKVQDVCVDQIVEIYDTGEVMEGSIFDEAGCEAICQSEWTDDIRECVGKATKCDSLSQTEPYCQAEEDDSIYEEPKEKEVLGDCDRACKKYKACAMLSPEAAEAEGNEAYASCLEVCQGWSNKTISCMNNTTTGTAMGCMHLSQCGLAEYSSILK